MRGDMSYDFFFLFSVVQKIKKKYSSTGLNKARCTSHMDLILVIWNFSFSSPSLFQVIFVTVSYM